MPLDVANTNRQLTRIAQQMDALRRAQGLLREYEDRLSTAWQSKEQYYFDLTAEELRRRCRSLEHDLDGLRGGIQRAMDEILREEMGFF